MIEIYSWKVLITAIIMKKNNFIEWKIEIEKKLYN